MKRILITGASGFLGQSLIQTLQDRYRVCGLYHTHAVHLEGCALTCLDIGDAAAVRAAFQEFHPDAVIHAAALSDVDLCEAHPDKAYRVNVQGTEHVAQAAAEIGARLIHISTDLIYDGNIGDYDEEDEPRPLMVYGRTKLEGERRAAAMCKGSVILRLALMYGRGDSVRLTFTDWLAQRLRAGHEVPVFIDQYRTPLYVRQGVEVIGRLIEGPGVHGVFNLGGGERINRYDFGLKFCEVFDLPKERLKPLSMEALDHAARRPRDCSLNHSKISALLQIRPLRVEEGLRALKGSLS